MRTLYRYGAALILCLAWATLIVPLSAQVDLSGIWTPRFHEDQPERIPGPEIGDYLGLPINAQARQWADSWSASRVTLPEHQCQVHVAPYIYRGPTVLRIWEERDPESQRLIAIHQYSQTYEQYRTIWMDGRPHPPDYARHTWMGFSTGEFQGGMLVVYTTHIKQGWVRRNGLPESDRATLSEHFIRHGNQLTHVSIVTDPVYLTEPLIKSQDFVLDEHYAGNLLYPCEYVEEILNRPKDQVPNYLPGENPFLTEFANRHKLPQRAARGGAETMYPEFQLHMATAELSSVAAPAAVGTQPDASQTTNTVHVLPVQGNVSMIIGPGGNSAVQIGKQGVLMVDTQLAESSDSLIAAVRTLSNGPLRYIINTSADPDHTGGNEKIRKAGVTFTGANVAGNLTDATVGAALIAHNNVLDRLSAPTGKKSELPPDGWPTDTFAGNEKELFFNGESIRIMHTPSAHTDGDSIVYFRRSDVISTGDIFLTTGYPVIDVQRGGSIQGEIDALNLILYLAIPEHEEEGGTLIIPGRGRLCDEFDVVEYRDMMVIVRDRVRAMLKKGMSLEQVEAAKPTFEYDGRYGANAGPWTTNMFVEAVYKSLAGKKE